MSKSIYVTSTIPYVNARPHIGFALELVQADVIARYHRLLGHRTRLQTGTDEHAFKNVLAARERGVPTQVLVDENAARFQGLCAALDISHDRFLRTTEPAHKDGVRWLWQRLRPEDLYPKEYEGRYCVGCEDFYRSRDLVDGRCPDHDAVPTTVRERNYFFRLSAYQAQLERLLESGELAVEPAHRRREVLQFVRAGLRDISVTRSVERAGGWGIPVPGDPSQVIYVWIDALINYLSGLGLGNGNGWQDVWHDDADKIHVIGKNVWKFHAIYWPALLLSAGLPLPNKIVVHGFLTVDGKKISKSLRNTVDPQAYIDRFGADGVRYYLLRHVKPFEDSDFSADRLRVAYNADLANGLGNLCSRLTALCEAAGYHGASLAPDPQAPDGYHAALSRFAFDEAVEVLWREIRDLNRAIEQEAPWTLLEENDSEPLRELLSGWTQSLHALAHWLAPFLPESSGRIAALLAQQPIRRAAPLFPRIGRS